MKLIRDASVALPMWLPEQHTDACLALREDVLGGVHELLAPDTLPIEVAHALTRAERQGRINQGQNRALFDGFLEICPTLNPYFENLDRAMQLSSAFRIGVFDCCYVALAEEQDCRVVTLDQRFLELFPDQTVSLQAL